MRAFTLFSGLIVTTAVFAVPVHRRTDDLSEANPFNIDRRAPVELPSTDVLNGLTSKLPTKDLPTGEATKKVEGITGTLPIKVIRRLDLTPVTDALAPVLKIVQPLLSSAISSLTKADASIKSLLANTESNASPLISDAQVKINNAVDKVQSAITALAKEGNTNIDSVQSSIGQVKVLATGLLADLTKLQDLIPGVPDLIATLTGLIQTVEGLGL